MEYKRAVDLALGMRLHVPDHLPVTIAIDGFGGAGKSSFAWRLAERLPAAQQLSIDDFINKDKLAETSWFTGVFDHKRLIAEVLDPCRHGNTFSYGKLHWRTNQLVTEHSREGLKFLIVEGISTGSMRLQPYFDLRFWIDTPLEVATERGRARDGQGQSAEQWAIWQQNDRDYFEYERPDLVADLVIDNSAPEVA